MNVTEFLNTQITSIISIIESLSDFFDSHKFIQVFTQEYQSEYLEMLNEYASSEQPFQSVHQQIARFLSENQATLRIQKQGKTKSNNIFGVSTLNENWRKV